MSCQSADNIVGSSGSTQHQEDSNSAIDIDNSVRQHLDMQNQEITVEFTHNQHDALRTTLDNWVNEAPEEEREVRQQVKDQIKIDNDQLVVDGNLDLSNTNISSLPQGLHVNGVLNLTNCSNLRILPQDLHVRRSLILEDCTSLTTLPQGLHVKGSLALTNCSNLTILPQGLTVDVYLHIHSCTSLTELPQRLIVRRWLDL